VEEGDDLRSADLKRQEIAYFGSETPGTIVVDTPNKFLYLVQADGKALRYGIGENLYGYEAISGFRAARSPVGLNRRTARTVITSYGRDTAVASTLFYRDTAPGKVGRQMQTWIRFPEGWRVVAAHVSIVDEPKETV
jgi:lipoprotein-anchoring transpeptidase ErfK/SrfK